MRIIICDDNFDDALSIKRITDNYFKNHAVVTIAYNFSNCKEKKEE